MPSKGDRETKRHKHSIWKTLQDSHGPSTFSFLRELVFLNTQGIYLIQSHIDFMKDVVSNRLLRISIVV